MKPLLSIVLSIWVLLFCAAPVAARDLVVSAAGSLTHAFNVLKTEFEKQHPGVRITANYAASGSLYRQMEQGAPVDVFASADMKWMDTAIKAGLVRKQDAVLFAQNAIVLAVPTQNPAAIEAVADLADTRVRRIAVGTPATVPAGNYAMLSLQELGLWDVLQPKFIFAENVRQVLDYIVRGEVDAGIVFSTDAKQAAERVRVVAALSMKEPAIYPIAPLTHSKQQALANEFIRFVLSERGQDIFVRFGFDKPE